MASSNSTEAQSGTPPLPGMADHERMNEIENNALKLRALLWNMHRDAAAAAGREEDATLLWLASDLVGDILRVAGEADCMQ
ncbi:hypothetical protein [Burkholderia sp. USMB20]|uniref:hypothetical protein n=2 Tax=Burkholderia TaxID=32008 RepID=UPI0010931B18|nr:hypothetical protein [Burkholderia sp. USMB20]TGN96927.1 hypothetical protein PL79_016390 [Burkholderia sp. USMB20]